MSWTRIAALALVAAISAPAAVQAAEVRAFDQAVLVAAQQAGRPVLVDVKAWWCPVCASQNRTIRAAVAAPAYNNLLILELNYDRQKPAWRALGVNKQATLIGYRGARELGRLQFVTDAAQINALLASLVR